MLWMLSILPLTDEKNRNTAIVGYDFRWRA